MPSIPRVRRRPLAVFMSLALMAAVLVPIGSVASAASASTTCPTGDFSCQMAISGPASVITGTPFTVQAVITTDGSTVAKTDPCVSKAPVSLAVYEQVGEGWTFVTSYPATASAGVATFSLSLPDDTVYRLDAAATNGEAYAAAASATGCNSYYDLSASKSIYAVAIPAYQPISPCPDNTSCVQTFGGVGSAATLFADDGSFVTPTWAGPTAGFLTGCHANPIDPTGVLDYSYLGSSSKTVVFALASSLVTKGIGLFNICWGASAPFPTLGGGTATGPDGDGLYWGVLPACGKNPTGPCVAFKKSNQKNVAFLGVFIPSSFTTGDPKGGAI